MGLSDYRDLGQPEYQRLYSIRIGNAWNTARMNTAGDFNATKHVSNYGFPTTHANYKQRKVKTQRTQKDNKIYFHY